MKKYPIFRKLFLFVIQINSCIYFLNAQQLAFRRLNVSDGLTSNVVAQAAFDRNGSLWFSTGEAINLYDGNNITQYHWRNYPFFPQSEVGFFSLDSYNRVWICYLRHLILIDETRKPQPYYLGDSLKNLGVSHCFEISGLGMVALTNKGTYYTSDITKTWDRFLWLDSLVNDKPVLFIKKFDSSTVIFKKGDKLLLANLKTKKLLLDISINGNVEACRINNDEILMGVEYKWEFFRISVSQKKIIKTYSNSVDQWRKPIKAELFEMALAANNKIYMTTRFSGLMQFDPEQESFFVNNHDFYSQHSLSSDNLRYLATDENGYLAVTSRAGVNIANVFQTSFTSVEYFREPNGNIIDEPVIAVIQDNKRKFWIQTQTQLFTWKREDNFVKPLLRLKDITAPGLPVFPGIPVFDQFERLWVPYAGYGIMIFDNDGKVIRELKNDKGSTGYIPNDAVRVIRRAGNNKMLVGSTNGIFIVDAVTFLADSIMWKVLQDGMRGKRVVDIMQDENIIWITTSPGGAIHKYDVNTNKLDIYTTAQGIASHRNYLLVKARDGNVYVSSYDGVTIFSPDGQLKRIDEQSGLADLRVEAIATDDSGYVWMTNTTTLIRYDPVRNRFDYFNEQHGINKTGFQITPACKTSTGELIFALNRGIAIVDPRRVNAWQQPVRFSIYRVNTNNTIEIFSSSSTLDLPYNNAKINFSYLNSDLISSGRFFYRYKMDGIDTAWSSPTRNHLIAYNLRPGNYRFQMQASYNETNWIDFPNAVSISVAAPFWQQWWFYALIGLMAVSVTTIVYKFIQSAKTQKKKLEELNRLMNESRLMAIRSQMNPHFIFNSLNAIQESIVMQDFDTAYQYLSKFSKLLRQVLNNSEKNFIPLKDEIEVNQLYLELESLRFKRSFSYSLSIGENIDTETVRFPSLLLQPFIENAIWHGLMHKQGDKKLDISFCLQNNHLECIIEDNGIGRERSAEIKRNKLGAQYFESKGTQLSGQRIQLLNETGHTTASIQIDDLKKNTGESEGTRVTLKLPLDYQT
ncbi:MAG TPA: histidine kinase [Chitinophagaceae bacterium]|nr:histidine kinase [Chitinophagaceae bacterium]